jgi:hypothetical protein
VLYTVPSATTAVVTNIVVTNTANAAGTFSISLSGTSLATTVAIQALDSTVIDLKQVLLQTQSIQGGASATSINFHIAGVEIS